MDPIEKILEHLLDNPFFQVAAGVVALYVVAARVDRLLVELGEGEDGSKAAVTDELTAILSKIDGKLEEIELLKTVYADAESQMARYRTESLLMNLSQQVAMIESKVSDWDRKLATQGEASK